MYRKRTLALLFLAVALPSAAVALRVLLPKADDQGTPPGADSPPGAPSGDTPRGGGGRQTGRPDVPRPAANVRKVALLIGVNEYTNRKLDNLRYAERDMTELAEVLKGAGFEVRVLLGSAAGRDAATRENIEAAITEMLRGRGAWTAPVGKSDTLLMAFSGHGQQLFVEVEGGDGNRVKKEVPFFCPKDAVPAEPGTLVSLPAVLKTLDEQGGGTNLLLVDACRDVVDTNRGRRGGIDSGLFATPSEGTAVFLACSSRQVARETDKMYPPQERDTGKGHGVFLHFIIEGLKGGAANDKGVVTWDRLVPYVKERVKDEFSNWFQGVPDDQRQRPQAIGNLADDPVLVARNKSLDPGDVIAPVNPPLAGRRLIGKLETPGVLVLTRGPDSATAWQRVEPTDPGVFASDPVMALPGYKADIRLDTDVVVHLWGHVPEQVPFDDLAAVMARLRILESRVRFHPPAAGFDADLTLETGRIYLTTHKQAGARIRLRFASEVWDVTLPNARSEVMAQTSTAYVPGAPFAQKGGEKPRTDVWLAVTRGSASVAAPKRSKKSDMLAAQWEITWDSQTDARPVPKKFPQGTPLTDRMVLLEGEQGRAIQKALSDTASRLTQKDGVRSLLEGRMNTLDLPLLKKPTDFEIAVAVSAVRFAIYGYSAIADGPDASAIVANLYDQLANDERGFARSAAVGAVSDWIGRAPGNTAIIHGIMTGKKRVPEGEADHIAHLLRGYSSPSTGDVSAVDTLVKDLDDPNIVVRELALGNLIAFFDPEAIKVRELAGLDVAARGQSGYKDALKRWWERGEEIKKRMLEKK